jgi:FSR family fosmidomycin resistance protein-like MFS transporter
LPIWEQRGDVAVKLTRVLANGALLTLMLGHFTNDLMGGVLPMLFPDFKDRFDLDNAAVGGITLAYSSASSLSQPIFGYLSDRFGRRWFVPIPLVWGACFVSLLGFADSFAVILILAALAGIGSGAYHPLGASNAAAVSPERERNTALSIYTAGGTTGYALGPLVAVAFLAIFGTEGTAVLFVPALVVAALIYSQSGRVERARIAGASAGFTEVAERVEYGVLIRVIVVVMLRSWVVMAPLQFISVWYDDLGYRSVFYGALATTVIISGVVGTIGGGILADRYGARRIIVSSLLLGIGPLLLFAGFPGPLAFVTGALLGVCFDSSLSVTLVAAQRLLPGKTGIASGVILGLGFITGGVGVPITGRVADEIGIQWAVGLLSLLALAGAALATTIPWERLGSRTIEATSDAESQLDGRLSRAKT